MVPATHMLIYVYIIYVCKYVNIHAAVTNLLISIIMVFILTKEFVSGFVTRRDSMLVRKPLKFVHCI